jgi:hypothetical protein
MPTTTPDTEYEPDSPPTPPAPLRLTLPTITIAHLLHTAVVAFAALLRLTHLGQSPLSPSEASQALVVWGAWQPTSQAANLDYLLNYSYSPAYFSLTSLVTFFMGFSDASMRLVPALAGIALVALPFWGRHKLGQIGALIAAVGFAISPTLTAVSRTAGGESLALLAGGILLLSWLRYQQKNEATYWYITLSALVAGLTTAPLFYSLLLVGGIAWLLQQSIGPRLFEQTSSAYPDKTMAWPSLLTAVFTFIFLGLALLSNMGGLGATVQLLTSWLGQFGVPSSWDDWVSPVLALARYDTAVLIVGLTGGLWATWRNHPWGSFFAYATVSGLLLLLLQPGEMSNILVMILPGYLLIGIIAQAIFPANVVDDWTVWPLSALFLILGLIVAHTMGRYARTPEPFNNSFLALAILSLVVWLVILGMIVVWEHRLAWQALFLSLLVLTAVASIGTARHLAYDAANDPRERWVQSGTADNTQQLVPFLRDLAGRYRGAARAGTVFSQVDHPSLRWYLRSWPQTTFGHTVPVGASYDFVITADTAVDPAVGTDYIGTSFQLWHPSTPHNLSLNDALRWWFFYTSPIPPATEEAILWLQTVQCSMSNEQ